MVNNKNDSREVRAGIGPNHGGRLVAILGHELRSHMAPIKNAAEVLRHPRIDAATTVRVAGIIERQIDGMTRLLDELLAWMQAEPSELLLRRSGAAVQMIIERSVEMIEPLMRAREQALSIRMPAESISIDADTIWLTQAVQNVLGNAVKYTGIGGCIEIAVTNGHADVEISIRDSGVGLTRAELETVFGLFTRVAQPSTQPTVPGLGVGLHVARTVVDAHGGSIWAVSDGPGHGSTFVIRLPHRQEIKIPAA